METYLIFLIFGFALIFLEIFVGVQTGFDALLVGVSLLLAGLASYSGLSLEISVFIAVFVLALYFVFGRRYIRNKLIVKTSHVGTRALVGKTAVCVKTISQGSAGQVKLAGEVWRAMSDSKIEINQEVLVEGVEGVSLIVKKPL